MTVANITADYFFKTDVVIAAILHDTVEDCEGCTVELIEKEFNGRVAEIVDRLTKNRFENGKHIILPLQETVDRLHKVQDYEALMIKEIDRIHNMETIEGLKPEKQRKIAEESTNILLGQIAFASEKTGIHEKYELEERLFKLTHNVLKKKDDDEE